MFCGIVSFLEVGIADFLTIGIGVFLISDFLSHCRSSTNVAVVIVDGRSGAVVGGLGTGSGGSECFVGGNWVDTGAQVANVTFECAGAASCTFLYDVRFSCQAGETGKGMWRKERCLRESSLH